ncbi:hypothetical protein NL460_28435, partial [Klebsiella pneumoniae]|nr:hypothetical protein [Klebsiella pneumoniae]
MAAAPLQVKVLHNSLGILTFALAGAVVVLPSALNTLGKVLVGQAIFNMVLMTLGFLPMAVQVVMVNSGLLLVL